MPSFVITLLQVPCFTVSTNIDTGNCSTTSSEGVKSKVRFDDRFGPLRPAAEGHEETLILLLVIAPNRNERIGIAEYNQMVIYTNSLNSGYR